MRHTPITIQDLRFNPPSLSEGEIFNALERYYGITGGTLKPLAGERDQNHLLITEGGRKLIVKIAGEDEDANVVDYQIKCLLHLEEKCPTLNIPRNLKSLNGNDLEILSSDHNHMLRVLSYVDGVPFGNSYEPPLKTIYDAAKFQGQLTAAISSFSHPHQGYFMPWDISNGLTLNPSLNTPKLGNMEDQISPMLDHFKENVFPKLAGLRKQTIHNDAHKGNMLKSVENSDDFCGLIDFGDICYAPTIQDLSIPLNSLMGDAPNSIENGAIYVKGYASHFPLRPEEIDILFDLVLMRATLTLQLIDFQIRGNVPNKEMYLKEYSHLPNRLEKLYNLNRDEVTHAFHQANREGTILNDQ